jgi:uncharacterized iron-regulated protein
MQPMHVPAASARARVGRAAPRVLAASLALACASSAPPPATAPSAAPEPPPPLPRDVVARAARPLAAWAAGDQLDEAELWRRLGATRAVCFGERHDNPGDHYAELRALENASEQAQRDGTPLGVGFEMFQRPFQSALSSYAQGRSSEDDLLRDSEYQKRWGFDYSLYRPLLERVRAAGLAAIALNAPKELSRRVAREGLDGLDAESRAGLPELVLDDAEHRAYFDRAMGDHPMPAGAPKADDMYAAQVLWDETMAESAASWLEGQPEGARVLVFAGGGHCHRHAIPARFTRRTGEAMLSVLPLRESELEGEAEKALYDLIVLLVDP